MSSRAEEDEFDSRFMMLGGESMPQQTSGSHEIFMAVKSSLASPCAWPNVETGGAAGWLGDGVDGVVGA